MKIQQADPDSNGVQFVNAAAVSSISDEDGVTVVRLLDGKSAIDERSTADVHKAWLDEMVTIFSNR